MKINERDAVPVSVRNLRLDAGLTGKEVAERMGVHPSVVSHMARSGTGSSASTLISFLEAVERPELAQSVREASATLKAVRGGHEPRSKALFPYFVATGQLELAHLMQSVTGARHLSWSEASAAAGVPNRYDQPV